MATAKKTTKADKPPAEKVRPEEVPPDTPLARAEAAHAAYEADPSGSNYNLWKQAELEHLTS
jgi:hypothetical protein